MRVALYQGRVSFGDMEANLRRTEEALDKAEAQEADVLCMPESFLQGYFPNREQAWAHSIDLQSDAFLGICERLARGKTMVLLGLNERRGDKLYNTVVVMDRGQYVGRYAKNYLVHDYFERGGDFPVFEKAGVKFGIIICADSSAIEPALIPAMRGAQVIFSPHFNYIPYDGVHDHYVRVRSNHVARAMETACFVCRSNVIVPESQGVTVFDRKKPGVGVGDSFVVNPKGQFVLEAGILTEKLLVYDIPGDQLAGNQRRFHRVSAAIVEQLSAEYRKLAAAAEAARAKP